MSTHLAPTARLSFRLPVLTDLPVYTAYCASPRTTFVGGPYDDVKAFKKLCAMIGHWALRGFGRYVIVSRETGRPLGHMGALQLSPTNVPEMTWTLWHGDDEGHGYITEACEAYLHHARTDLAMPHMVARIYEDNHASRAVAARLGAVHDPNATPPDWMPGGLTYHFDLEGRF